MARRADLSEEEVERLVALRERGLSEAVIARMVGCCQGSVSWALLREGIDVHLDRRLPPVPAEPVVQHRCGHLVRRFTQAEDAQLLALEAQGLTVHAISRRLGRRNNSVLGRLRTLARREARAEHQAMAAE
ncbi:hypothetical protein [Phenylobacterium sp.]|uniref:hypothetical protein n=1 Tax=Phenylobacterium sp. TaxID=1871053 RepID=UPI002DE82AA8|nr:hypothetical protein [Phenylobacterium sp.]